MPRLLRAAATSRCTGPWVFSMSVSSFCASGVASEYLPALLSSVISALRAAALCAHDGAERQLLAASASHNENTNRLRDFMDSGLLLHGRPWGARACMGRGKAFARSKAASGNP